MKKSMYALVVLMAMMITGCDEFFAYTPPPVSNYEMQSKKNEENAKAISQNQGMPVLSRSMDYENVKKRALYLNQGNNIGYLYLLTGNGQLVRESQVLGKVTSLNTYITPMEEVKILKHDGEQYSMETPVVISAPDIDGTYGENVSGIFWFTPDGVYQEWNGMYIFSSERLSFTSVPMLVKSVE